MCAGHFLTEREKGVSNYNQNTKETKAERRQREWETLDLERIKEKIK
jgi:hypothetical protein